MLDAFNDSTRTWVSKVSKQVVQIVFLKIRAREAETVRGDWDHERNQRPRWCWDFQTLMEQQVFSIRPATCRRPARPLLATGKGWWKNIAAEEQHNLIKICISAEVRKTQSRQNSLGDRKSFLWIMNRSLICQGRVSFKVVSLVEWIWCQ